MKTFFTRLSSFILSTWQDGVGYVTRVCVCVCVIRKASLRELDKAAELSIIGHSIGAFVSTLDAPHLKHLATNVVRDVTSWIVKLFRYSTLCLVWHNESQTFVSCCIFLSSLRADVQPASGP